METVSYLMLMPSGSERSMELHRNHGNPVGVINRIGSKVCLLLICSFYSLILYDTSRGHLCDLVYTIFYLVLNMIICNQAQEVWQREL